MLGLKTDIEIHATPERVWSILLDFSQYAEWNPFIRSIEGVARAGEQLTVVIQPQGSRGMTFRPTVLAATPNRELRWLGRFLIPGIFDGEHYFQIVPLAPDRVKFVHGEKFSGILISFAKARLEGETKSGFLAMNEALKSRAEA